MGGVGGWWQVRKACMAGSRNGSERGRAVGCTLLPRGMARCDAWPSRGGEQTLSVRSPETKRCTRSKRSRRGAELWRRGLLVHQVLRRPGALLGNHFIFIIFIKYSYYDG